MKFYKTLFFIFIFLTCSVKADLNNNLINELKQGGKLIFIRHAYAPGNGDPQNFNLYDCSTQRNLSENGREQSKKIGNLFLKNKIDIKIFELIRTFNNKNKKKIKVKWLSSNLPKGRKFENFLKSQEFVNKVGEIAESEGHHPDLWF